jgi:hypothetical protein
MKELTRAYHLILAASVCLSGIRSSRFSNVPNGVGEAWESRVSELAQQIDAIANEINQFLLDREVSAKASQRLEGAIAGAKELIRQTIDKI